MSRSTRARWWNSAALIGVGTVLVAVALLLGAQAPAVAVAAVTGVLALHASPVGRTRTTGHWDAQQRHVRDGSVIVYWRPGCPQCLRMRVGLAGAAGRVQWVDIWADPEAAAFVRDVNAGAEVVPTVILPDGEACTDPDPALVRASLEAGRVDRGPGARAA